MAILRDLEARGVTAALVVTDEEAAFFKKAGWVSRQDGWWTKAIE